MLGLKSLCFNKKPGIQSLQLWKKKSRLTKADTWHVLFSTSDILVMGSSPDDKTPGSGGHGVETEELTFGRAEAGQCPIPQSDHKLVPSGPACFSSSRPHAGSPSVRFSLLKRNGMV